MLRYDRVSSELIIHRPRDPDRVTRMRHDTARVAGSKRAGLARTFRIGEPYVHEPNGRFRSSVLEFHRCVPVAPVARHRNSPPRDDAGEDPT